MLQTVDPDVELDYAAGARCEAASFAATTVSGADGGVCDGIVDATRTEVAEVRRPGEQSGRCPARRARGGATAIEVSARRTPGVDVRRRQGHPAQLYQDAGRGPRSRRAVGVGDVAGERGDRAARPLTAFNRGDLDAAFEDFAPDFEFDMSRAIGIGPQQGRRRSRAVPTPLDEFIGTWDSFRWR